MRKETASSSPDGTAARSPGRGTGLCRPHHPGRLLQSRHRALVMWILSAPGQPVCPSDCWVGCSEALLPFPLLPKFTEKQNQKPSWVLTGSVLLAAIRWLAGKDMWGQSPKHNKVNAGDLEISSTSVWQRLFLCVHALFLA